MATFVGIPEVVEEIIGSFPALFVIKTSSTTQYFIFAIINRRDKIYNIIYQIEGLKQVLLLSQDTGKNNCLHLAGYLEPWTKLNNRESGAGAVLQLQRELQWFKEVENITLPQDKEVENSEKKTPAMVFVEAHEELTKEGEQWMKDTSNACLIVATLIATVLFITVPGGSNIDTGFPIVLERRAFKIFAISDVALSLIRRFPKLPWGDPCPLITLAVNRLMFPSKAHIKFWRPFIGSVMQILHPWLRIYFENLGIKTIGKASLMHHEAIELVRFICLEVLKLDCGKAIASIGLALRLTTELGNHEVVQEIMAIFPDAMLPKSEKNESLFHQRMCTTFFTNSRIFYT